MKSRVMKVLGTLVIAGLLITNVQFLLAEGVGGGTDPQCTAGGPGSSSCSITVEAGIAGTGGSYSCSVTCSTGYACCSVTGLWCRCKGVLSGQGGGGPIN